ncbi:hypothetical protein AAFF_G00388510 [Aldrovandia affinis]|uniref:Uncharacterized protein n=1 Tax=Aldrovandia affinis TaxID=143900 RepID=A0AAD7VYP6_9TELE|nr:hypothetical protein AAFF_G00388510 [Aldrovandia affinis]
MWLRSGRFAPQRCPAPRWTPRSAWACSAGPVRSRRALNRPGRSSTAPAAGPFPRPQFRPAGADALPPSEALLPAGQPLQPGPASHMCHFSA